ncbi:MAG: BsuPI-related putative proteinase inhibitor [Verrucomicrobiota bacterium]|nr:BsuPI-related putative proteinase inhibitor [Verrucomicrobiota bacterium]
MRVLLAVVSLGCLLLSPAFASDEIATQPPRRGVWSRILHPFQHAPPPPEHHYARTKNLALSMTVAPMPLHLSDTRQLRITIVLANVSKRFVQLAFPTTQRMEILVRDESGKIVTQWSEDQSFENSADYISINAGERLEYSATISTRDMTAGRKYTIESFFPNYPDLIARQPLVAER